MLGICTQPTDRQRFTQQQLQQLQQQQHTTSSSGWQRPLPPWLLRGTTAGLQ
jgi:hypothetical protein